MKSKVVRVEDDFRGEVNLAFTSSEAYAQPRKSVFIPAFKSAEDTLTSEDKELEKRSVMKNLVYVYLSILLISSPMYALINSASSLLSENGIGLMSLSALGATQVLAAIALGSYTTKVWGTKRIITVSYILIIMYVLSFFYASLPTAIVGAALMGLGYTLIFTATFLYGNILGMWYACVASVDLDNVVVLMLGAINSAFGGGIFLGNIVYFFILYPVTKDSLFSNVTEEQLQICGTNYCNEDLSNLKTMQAPEPWRYYTLMSVFAAMGVVGVLLTFLVKDFSVKLGCEQRKKRDFLAIVIEPWMLLKDPRGYLLIFITTFIGIEQAFLFSEFTQAYISCIIGKQQVGMVMLVLGFAQFAISAITWIGERYFGRVGLMIISMVMIMGCFVTLIVWKPQTDQTIVFYVISIVWGIADAVILSVVLAVYGLLFDDNIEGSFALCNFWFSLGYLLSFGWSPFLCVSVKLYITMGVGCIGLVCYIFLEILNRKTGSLNLSSTISGKLKMDLPTIAMPTHFKRISVTQTTAYMPR